MLADRLRDHAWSLPPLPLLPAHVMPGFLGLFMLESVVDDVECLWPNRGLSLEMVLLGEPGEGGELAWDDLAELRADSEKELSLRP